MLDLYNIIFELQLEGREKMREKTCVKREGDKFIIDKIEIKHV